jgi:hypothetical protein
VTYSFQREKPFPKGAPAAHVERYREALASELRQQFPNYEIAVEVLDAGVGDVVFEPEDELSADERLSVALAMKSTARRLAARMLGKSGARPAGSSGSNVGGRRDS